VIDAFAGDVMERWIRCPACDASSALLKRRAPGSQAATPLECAVIEHALDGAHPALAVLREQWEASTVARREFTGAGSFTTLLVPPSVRRLSTTRRVALRGPSVQVLNRSEPIGSVLFVESGQLAVLEMFAYAEPWPSEASTFSIEHELGARTELDGWTRRPDRPVRVPHERLSLSACASPCPIPSWRR
jgi:hypothetical protein